MQHPLPFVHVFRSQGEHLIECRPSSIKKKHYHTKGFPIEVETSALATVSRTQHPSNLGVREDERHSILHWLRRRRKVEHRHQAVSGAVFQEASDTAERAHFRDLRRALSYEPGYALRRDFC
jgi:hypothetical protein